VLTLTEYQHDGWTVLEVAGELDIATAPQLRARIRELLGKTPPAGTLVVDLMGDLTGLRLLDAAGAGVFAHAQHPADHQGPSCGSSALTGVCSAFSSSPD
jgi:anti-anti-sigma factor